VNKNKRLPLYIAGGAGLAAVAVTVGVAVAGSSGSAATALTTSPKATAISTRTTGVGQVLVDAQGRAVYLFQKDTGPTSTCVGACASDWPPVPVTGTPHTSGGASAQSLGSTTRPDGVRQLTYAGHPLYYFAGDNKAGQTGGQAINEFGAEWYTLDAAGKAITRAPVKAKSGGGYGY
jgi:predicted lipoprotein with Yx(FWY)xxD motif